MISARRLVEASGNFWRDLTPMLPNYVKHVNMGGYDRSHTPIRRGTEKARHFLINELAFSCFAQRLKTTGPDASECYSQLQSKWSSRLPNNPWIELPISDDERADLSEMVSRLAQYSRNLNLGDMEFEVVVPAVGRLEAVEIDILSISAIVEVKSGERPFRSIDFRQIILSAIALEKVSRRDRIILLNPREGIIWEESLTKFIEAVSLRTFAEFVDDAFYELSDVGISA